MVGNYIEDVLNLPNGDNSDKKMPYNNINFLVYKLY